MRCCPRFLGRIVTSVSAPEMLATGPAQKLFVEAASEWPRPIVAKSDAALPPPMRTNYIDRSPVIATSFNSNYKIKSFRQRVCASTDVSMRPLMLLCDPTTTEATKGWFGAAQQQLFIDRASSSSYGEKIHQLSCRWAAKFYGQVTFGPRNYPYPSSRWLARRFRMKKHRILKRFRFRRYKLAAVANLPFAKMIRVGMLPELKSSKTKKGDTVDLGLSSQLVTAAKTSTGGKTKGRRTRPKSKYQV